MIILPTQIQPSTATQQQQYYHQQHQTQQQQHPLGTLNSNYRQLIEEEERQKREAEEAARKELEEKEKAANNSNNNNNNRSASRTATTNDSPPTSPPRSEAPPPSDDEFTNFVLRRAAMQLGVDYVPGQFSHHNSPNNQNQNHRSSSSMMFQPPQSMMMKSQKQQQKKDNNSDQDDQDEEQHQNLEHRSASQQQQQQQQPPSSSKHHHHHPTSSSSAPRGGAAHPIDALKAHHWQEQISVEELGDVPPPRFPSTLKAARRIASVEKRLQEPPPSGLQRFGQFIDCSPEEIARMIDLRETSLGQTHASVAPLYDVLGDMLLFEGDSAQAEKYYNTCLQRLDQRSAHMQKQEKEDLEKLQRKNNTSSAAKLGVSRFHPSNKTNPNSWFSQASNWTQEVATVNAKLGMLWLQQGKKEAACSAFLRAAELSDPSAMNDFGTTTASRAGSTSAQQGGGLYKRGQSPNPSSSSGAAGTGSGSAFTRFGSKNETPEITHLRQLVGGVVAGIAVGSEVRGGGESSSTNTNTNQPRDRKAIASALADRVLIGLKSPTKTTEVQTVLSSTARTGRGGDQQYHHHEDPNANNNNGNFNYDEFAPISTSRGGSRSGSQQQQQQNTTGTSTTSNARITSSSTPLRRSSVSQPNVMHGHSPLHDAHSLRNLVDSITHDGKVEDSRRRMRSSLGQLQQAPTGSLSPSRMHHSHHHPSAASAATSADTNEALRKTKDLQDIISRIRKRTDLMTNQNQ